MVSTCTLSRIFLSLSFSIESLIMMGQKTSGKLFFFKVAIKCSSLSLINNGTSPVSAVAACCNFQVVEAISSISKCCSIIQFATRMRYSVALQFILKCLCSPGFLPSSLNILKRNSSQRKALGCTDCIKSPPASNLQDSLCLKHFKM